MIATQSERESLLVFLWQLKTNQISNLLNPDFPWRLIFRVNDQLIKIEEMLRHSESECHTVDLESWRESLPLILILSTSQPPVRSLSSHFFAPATAFDLKSGRNGCSDTKLAKNFRQHFGKKGKVLLLQNLLLLYFLDSLSKSGSQEQKVIRRTGQFFPARSH